MSIIAMTEDGGVVFCGNGATKIWKKMPKNFDFVNQDGKWMRPYFLKWREKIGKLECDCTEVEEHYQPYYGSTFYHSKDCCLIRLVKEKPQLMNLWCYQHLPALPIDYDL